MKFIQFGLKSMAWILASAILSADKADASVNYSYDPVGRIATALYDNGACILYSYDAAGNQTVRTVAGYGVSGAGLWGTGSFGSFAWGSANVPAVWGTGIYGCFRWSN